MTDPVVKFLQETLVEDTQGRVACADLRFFNNFKKYFNYFHKSALSGQKFGNPINMVSMGMKLRFLYPAVTRVKINNRAFYTNVSVRDAVSQSQGEDWNGPIKIFYSSFVLRSYVFKCQFSSS